MDFKTLFKLKINNLIKNKMNTTEAEGARNAFKGKLKQKFATLTDDDLMFAEGKKEEMLGNLEKKLGQTKEQIKKAVAEL